MAKAVGVDPGEYEVKVVELDGSYRRPRLSRVSFEPVGEGSVSASDESHAARQAEATLLALEEGGFSRDNLSMSFPCREAVLRTLNVPFVGEERIRKVIKFEAESAIHSHNVDDMVVDFHVIEESDSETKVLIAAVPKAPLRVTLNGLERAGLEPMVVDLDTMALFRTAEWCGAFDAEEFDADGDDANLPAAGVGTSVVLDIGARSTRVLVVSSGQLVDVRTLRTGADSIAEEIAVSNGIGLADAREAVWGSLRTGEDYLFDAGADEDPGLLDDGEGNGSGDALAPVVDLPEVRNTEVVDARDRYLSRLRRELVRFLTSVSDSARVESVWVTGGASALPEVHELLADVFGVTPRNLEILAGVNHKLSDEEAAELDPKLAVAVGLALCSLGGKTGMNFRQEDLAFTKGFDRVKFPLAVTCMLALFLVLVFAVRLRNELDALEREYGSVYEIEKTEVRGREKKKVLFNGYLGAVVNPPNSWFATPRYFDKKEYDKLVDKLLATPVFERLPKLRKEVARHFLELQQESGYYPDLRLGSGLGALVELSTVLQELESRLGRYLLTELELKLQHRDEARFMVFTVALRTDEISSFREKGETLRSTIEQRCGLPQSCFLSLNKDTGEKDVFEGEGGRGGYFYRVRIDLKSETDFPVFPASQQ